jgi:DNA polymerase delta subunit 1
MEVFGWHCFDSGERFITAGVGCLPDGAPAVVWYASQPYFYVRLRGGAGTRALEPMASTVRIKELVPLNNNPKQATDRYAKMSFKTSRAMRSALSRLSSTAYEIAEADVPPITRAFHQGVPSCGWIELPPAGVRSGSRLCAADVYEAEVDGPSSIVATAPQASGIRVATWDVEVFSSESTPEDQRFPDAHNPGDELIQIVTYFSSGGSTAYLAHAVVLAPGLKGQVPSQALPCAPARWELEVVDTEQELLQAWVRVMARERPLVWQHFNGLGFDEPYVYKRAVHHNMERIFDSMSVLKNCPVKLETSKMESAAYGANEFHTISVPGVFHLDLHTSIKKEFKLVSYSLNACGEHFLKDTKEDMKPQELFDTFRANTAAGHRRILDYCAQDVSLTFRLGGKLNFLTNLKEMASATMVPLEYLLKRGQQVKVQSLICNLTTKRGMVMCTWPKGKVHGNGYKGAFVLDPHRGAYFRPVLTLDFASLYPSIMRAHNMSHDTLVLKEADVPEGREVDWVNLDEDGYGWVGFLQRRPDGSGQGICPELLESLAAMRKAAKKEMAKFEKLAHETADPVEKERHKLMEAVYNAKQLAYKVRGSPGMHPLGT